MCQEKRDEIDAKSVEHQSFVTASMKLQEPGKYEGAEVMRASQTLSACADSDMLATINKDASELISIEEQRNPLKEAYRLAMHNNYLHKPEGLQAPR